MTFNAIVVGNELAVPGRPTSNGAGTVRVGSASTPSEQPVQVMSSSRVLSIITFVLQDHFNDRYTQMFALKLMQVNRSEYGQGQWNTSQHE